MIGNPQGNSHLVELDVNGDNIKMNANDVGCESGGLSQMDRDMVPMTGVVNMVINLLDS